MDALLGPLAILAVVTIYLLPTIIAVGSNKRNSAAIFVVDLLLGWTFIGWVLCLAWSLAEGPEPT